MQALQSYLQGLQLVQFLPHVMNNSLIFVSFKDVLMGAVVHVLVSKQNRDEQTEIDINIPTSHMNEELMKKTYSGKLRALQSCSCSLL